MIHLSAVAERAASELVTAAEIGRRLSLSAERIRQLARDPRFPEPAGTAGRNTMWHWDVIANWAAATGRLASDGRQASQAWKPARRSAHRFRRAVDTIVDWERRSILHVRIWQPIENQLRPVVLLGALDDNHGWSLTNGIEIAASTVATTLLGPEGLYADWYEYWPDRFGRDHEFSAVTFTVMPLSRLRRLAKTRAGDATMRRARKLGGALEMPKWAEIARESFEELVGEEVELYPHGVYTSAVVRRHVVEGVVEATWDPSDLARDVEAAMALLTDAADDLPGHIANVAALILVDDHVARSAENQDSAASQPRGLAVRLAPYCAPSSIVERLTDLRSNEALIARTKEPVSIFDAVQQLRRWLNKFGSDDDRLLLAASHQGLSWLEPWQAGVTDEMLCSEPTAAVRHAERRLTSWLLEFAPDIVQADYPSLVPSEVFELGGHWTARYLETVSWWGPAPEHEIRARRLRPHLADDLPTRTGYDPWGRIVMMNSENLLLEWPVGRLDHLVSDQAQIVADSATPGPQPVFIALPDGRLDLLPVAPECAADSGYTWGYAGGGPRTLAAALELLVGTDTSRSCRSAYDFVTGWERTEVRITVGELRNTLILRSS